MNEADKNIIKQASLILENHFKEENSVLINSHLDAIKFLKFNLSLEEREVFAVMFLNNQHRLISFEKVFFGTVAHCSVHAREIIKMALGLNASAVIFSHNHPSGNCKPSDSDLKLTKELKGMLETFEIRVLDHVIVGRLDHFSFNESGIL